MASGSVSRVDDLPPALPLKQHRSRSSVEAECVTLSPVELQAQNDAFSDVFIEPTDCHAAQCPIHQRYDPSRHQERFFSDGTPPPVPKKRFARTLSFPATSASPQCPWSPLSLLPKNPQNYDNPLYMLAPVAGSYFHQCGKEVKTARKSPVPSLSLSQLSFDTADEHLPQLFGGFDDQTVVSQGIQHCHGLFLRRVVQNMEAGILLQDEATDNHARSYQPQDFLLNEGSQPKQIGNSFYYSLQSPKFPGRVLGLKVHKQTNENPTKHQLSHVNVQNVVAVFTPSIKLKRSDPTTPFKPGCTAANPPDGGSTEYSTDPAISNVTTVESLLDKGITVSVERDLPHATLEDFVQDSRSLQSADSLVWDRQVCVLLLQILMASQHLYNTSATTSELRPWEIFLVWSCRERSEGEGFKIGRLKEDTEWEETASKGRTQMLWRTHGSPRVVLNPQSLSPSASHPLPSIKSQIGALLQYCLAPQERSISSLDSDPNPSKSSYQRGLHHLSSLLQNESSSLQIVDMVAMLQVLLWGPSVTLFNPERSVTAAVNSWLTVKRALLVMKLAERGLMGDQAALDWDDCMCLQYLSSTDPETVVSVTRQLFEDRSTFTGCLS
ncbi:hypothetical protein JOB18_006352 [Solea senegalensis]|uniref:PEAK1 n=1 Tax=Solea senegalensis TaxID=28829 RepID=A0AAV6S9Z8_SOLSE|nr:inactive tyrosine-protein kinase PEAK1 [Solea senegalensis]KAG7513377.1 hypothetical protein JOB18_006352 [Solea senegalensis]